MAGRNLFESYQRGRGPVPGRDRPCVFISHNSSDKPMARAVADALCKWDVDIYFDERDDMLQTASISGDDPTVVKCIEDGLDKSTHLLGLITKRTFNSWWVAYEIGGANGRQKACAHLVEKNVDRLPSYVKVASVLLDTDGLAKWIPRGATTSTEIIKERMQKTATESQLESFVPSHRPKFRVTYY